MTDPDRPRSTSSSRRAIRAFSSIAPGPRRDGRPRVALVLSGGGARGAYEAGVLRYLCDAFPRETGVTPWFDVVCGTSVGALNACFVAATADVLDQATPLLWERWLELRADALLRIRPMELLRFGRSLLGGAPIPLEPPGSGADAEGRMRRGGILDTSALERFVLESVPWSRIGRNVDAGVVHALSVSATHVATGKTVVFVDTAPELPTWSRDPHVRPVRTRIAPWHALASAAIPLLFPPMPIDGTYYVDGGLRQNTPLSPAIRLGADRVLVVSLRYRSPSGVDAPAKEESLPSPFFLAGKALNALLIDRVDHDLDRLRHMNAILRVGQELCGPAFVAALHARMAAAEQGSTRMVQDLLVRPSEDLGALAAAYAKSAAFETRSSLSARVFRRLAERDPSDDADLLSYVMFDGGFGKQLLELGFEDARRRRDELVALFT